MIAAVLRLVSRCLTAQLFPPAKHIGQGRELASRPARFHSVTHLFA